MDFSVSVKEALSRVTIRNEAFIGGRYRRAASGETFECRTPINGSLLTRIAASGEEDVEAAVRAARASFEEGLWRDLPPKEKKKRLLAFADIMEAYASELALLETLDMGKPVKNARGTDIPLSIETVRYYAEAIDKVNGEIGPSAPNVVSMIVREPLGVVAAIIPWNYPLLMATWKFAPALASGNSVILKPAEQASLTALRLGEFAAEAEIPEGVFNVLPGDGAVGKALCLNGDVDGVVFTGSTAVGKLILGYSGQSNMKRVALECGGKSPQIVFADCPDFAAAAAAAAWGVFYDQGQVCTAGSRLLVEEGIREEFLARVVAIAKTLKPGDPLDPETTFGAMVDETQMSAVLSYIEAGRNDGARLACGGVQALAETGGNYIAPTVFDNVAPTMKIAREEIFGPVLSAISFRTFDEAMAIANDTMYGLAAGLWTSDLDKAHVAARRLRAGNVWVNCWDTSDITTPFGGFKQSGTGRDRSLHAFDKYTEMKTIWIELRAPK